MFKENTLSVVYLFMSIRVYTKSPTIKLHKLFTASFFAAPVNEAKLKRLCQYQLGYQLNERGQQQSFFSSPKRVRRIGKLPSVQSIVHR